MRLPIQYDTSLHLEKFLGDPFDPANVLSFARSVELDEREQYPQEAVDLLDEWGMQLYYVPSKHGGRLKSYEEMFSLLKLTSRRDLTVAITHLVSYVAASTVWVGGNDLQRARVVELLRDRNQISIGFHEKEHGHDFLACELQAAKVGGGYLLSGEKWVIGNPKRASTIIIYTRTSPGGGARGFSLFFLEKERLDQSRFEYLPKFPTQGVRGHEVAGIRFNNCFVPDEAVLGQAGNGVEVTFKSSQITRTLFAAMSIGAGSTALRHTLDFALSRRLYGDTVFSIPHAQGLLIDSFLDLLICDCVGTACSRAFHAVPDQINILSAIAKYFIPTTIEGTIHNLSLVLGARAYLRNSHCWGYFQKIVRDVPMVRVAHLSSIINLSYLAQQLQQMTVYRKKADLLSDPEVDLRLSSVFSLAEPLPEFDPANLTLYNKGREDCLQGLGSALERLEEMRADSDVDPEVLGHLLSLTRQLLAEADAQDAILAEVARKKDQAFNRSSELYELAKRYCALHAGAACLQMWIRNRKLLDEFFWKGEWLVLSLDYLLRAFQPDRLIKPRPYLPSMAREIERRFKERVLFSIVPLQLANDNQI